jgi:hypothetical protein
MSTPSKKFVSYEEIKLPVEFGGPFGVLFLIIWSHYILFYFWYVMILLYLYTKYYYYCMSFIQIVLLLLLGIVMKQTMEV